MASNKLTLHSNCWIYDWLWIYLARYWSWTARIKQQPEQKSRPEKITFRIVNGAIPRARSRKYSGYYYSFYFFVQIRVIKKWKMLSAECLFTKYLLPDPLT